MSFEEWWNTKDYPARCKGNCKEAYEAGMKADVHTDNSNVIAELEAQIEKMKCCSNCDNWNWKHSRCEKKLKGDCFKQSKWVLRKILSKEYE